MSADLALAVLLAATWLHLGFQATVTVVVYPALARVPEDAWRPAHDRHSRAIAPLVAVVYGALVAGAAAVLATDPTAATVVAVAAAGVAVLTTAVRAAPLHGRLGTLGHRDARVVGSLLAADRVRLLAAAVAATAAGLAAVSRWG